MLTDTDCKACTFCSGHTTVNVGVAIVELGALNDKTGAIRMKLRIGQEWVDPRIEMPAGCKVALGMPDCGASSSFKRFDVEESTSSYRTTRPGVFDYAKLYSQRSFYVACKLINYLHVSYYARSSSKTSSGSRL